MMNDSERAALVNELADLMQDHAPEIETHWVALVHNGVMPIIDRLLLDKYERKPEEPPLRWEMPPGNTPCEICGRGFTPRGPYRYTCNSRHSDQRRAKYNRMHASNAYYKKKRERMGSDIRAITKEQKNGEND